MSTTLLEVRELLDRWVRQGLVPPDQAAAILDSEALREGGIGVGATDTLPSVMPSVVHAERHAIAEVIGYLGGALMCVAGMVAFGRYWDLFDTWARVLLLGASAVLLAGAGEVVRRREGDATWRLAAFLWLLAVPLVSGTTGVAVHDWGGLAAETSVISGTGAGAAVGFALWLLHMTPAQQIGMVLPVSIGGGVALAELHVDVPFVGLAMWGAGLAWVILGWGRVVRPQGTAYALGCLGIIIGSQVFSVGGEAGAPLLLGLLSALALLGTSVPARSPVLLGFGVASVFMFVPETVFRVFGESGGAPLALFVSGGVLIAVSVLAGSLREGVRGAGNVS